MSSIRREVYVHEELLEERLRILLDRLGWTYAALWTLNPRTRVFEWKRGCFNEALTGTKEGTSTSSSSSSSPTVWDAQLFYTTYKSCSFAPGSTGAVGRVNLEGKHIWLTGDAVFQSAVSLEQSQFLRCSKIQTMMCIPWVDSVLEIGTAKLVGENFVLMDQIQQVLSRDLLEPDPFEHAPAAASSDTTMFQAQHHQDHPSHAELPTNLALQQPSSMGRGSPRASNQRSASFQSEFSLSDQVWRSGNSANLNLNSDTFMQDSSVIQPNRVKENLSFTLETGTPTSTSSLQMPIGSTAVSADPAPNWRSEINFRDSAQQSHGLMVSQADQYRSWSGAATSSSVSSQSRDSSAPRPSASPDQLLHQQIFAKSSPNSRFPAHDRTSSSSVRQQLHSQQLLASPYSSYHSNGARNPHQIRRTTSCGDEYEVQKALSLFEAQEMHDQWRGQAQQLPLLNPDVTVARSMLRSSPSPEPSQYNDSTTLQTNNLHFWQREGSTGSPDPALQILPPQGNDAANSNRPTTTTTVKRSSNASIMNQVSKVAGPLLRRHSLQSALEVLKKVDHTYQKQALAAKDDQVLESNETSHDLKVHQICEDQPPGPSHVQINAGPNLRGRRRTVGVEHPGPVHAGHDEAAVNHMLAERRRRVKQKENFTALRRLVPIISKADKASTLIDAITYLKHLQNQIEEMEASKEDIDQRCQSLENKCKQLEKQNQDLAEIISSNDQPNGMVHVNQVTLKLQSTKSI